MAKLRVNSFSVSLDGYGAGPSQSLQNPLGIGGENLHHWMFGTRTFRRLFGNEGGATGVDDDDFVRLHRLGADAVKQAADVLGFVVRADDDGNLHEPGLDRRNAVFSS